MTRGFLNGLALGGGVSIVGVVAISLLTEPPGPPQISTAAPESRAAPERTAANVAPQPNVAPADSVAETVPPAAPLSEQRDPVVSEGTIAPPTAPVLGTAEIGVQPEPPTPEAAPVAVTAEATIYPNPQAQRPQAPELEPAAAVSTAPPVARSAPSVGTPEADAPQVTQSQTPRPVETTSVARVEPVRPEQPAAPEVGDVAVVAPAAPAALPVAEGRDAPAEAVAALDVVTDGPAEAQTEVVVVETPEVEVAGAAEDLAGGVEAEVEVESASDAAREDDDMQVAALAPQSALDSAPDTGSRTGSGAGSGTGLQDESDTALDSEPQVVARADVQVSDDLASQVQARVEPQEGDVQPEAGTVEADASETETSVTEIIDTEPAETETIQAETAETETAETETAETETAETETAETDIPVGQVEPRVETQVSQAQADDAGTVNRAGARDNPVVAALPTVPALDRPVPAPAPEPSAEAVEDPDAAPAPIETAALARPTIGRPANSLLARDSVLRQVSENTGSTATAVTAKPRPLESFSVGFTNPDARPLLSIVLMDQGVDFGSQDIGVEALGSFPYQISFAVDAGLPDAADRAAIYRAQGFEVLALVDLPGNLTAADTEVALSAALAAVPEAVGVLEGPESGLQGSKDISDQVNAILRDTGHGIVWQPKGLDTAQKIAARDGIASRSLFRDFDKAGQKPVVIRRFLDQGAFKARQQNGVIMVGRVRPDTVSALLLWGLQDRASRVAVAPVSAVLKAKAASGG